MLALLMLNVLGCPTFRNITHKIGIFTNIDASLGLSRNNSLNSDFFLAAKMVINLILGHSETTV